MWPFKILWLMPITGSVVWQCGIDQEIHAANFNIIGVLMSNDMNH